ncbi:CAP-Gly domain-containing linker protein 2, partial [Podochytrium sp. JEL0797]
MNVSVGDRVEVSNAGTPAVGVVQYMGATQFAAGVWIGIALEPGSVGKNDGSVQGMRYFECGGEQRGVFVRLAMVKRVLAPSVANTPNATRAASSNGVRKPSGTKSPPSAAPTPSAAKHLRTKTVSATPSTRTSAPSFSSSAKPTPAVTRKPTIAATPSRTDTPSAKPPSVRTPVSTSLANSNESVSEHASEDMNGSTLVSPKNSSASSEWINEKARLDDHVAQLTQNVSSLQSQLRETLDQLSSAKSLVSVQPVNPETEELLTSLTFENESLRTQLISAQSAHASLSRESTARIQEIEARLIASSAKCDTLEKVNQEREGSHSMLDEQQRAGFNASPLAEKDEIVAALTSEIEDLKSQLKTAKQSPPLAAITASAVSEDSEDSLPKEVKDARARQLAQLMKEVEDLRIRLQITEQANASAAAPHSSSNTLETQLSILNDENETLRAQLHQSQSQLLTLQITSSSPTAAADDSSAFEIASLHDDIDTLRAQLDASETRMRAVEAELQETLTNRDAARHELETKMEAIVMERLELEETVQELNEKLAETKAANKSLTTQLSALPTSTTTSTASQIESLTLQLQDTQLRLQLAESRKHESKTTTQQIDQLTLSLGTTSILHQTATAKISTLQDQIRALESDVGMLQAQLEEANDVIESVTLDCELEKEVRETAERELQEMRDQVEELNMDLDFVVSKKPEIQLSPDQFEGVVTEINLLNNQNERLKDALV